MSRSIFVLLALLAFAGNLAAQPLRMYAESAVEYTVLRGDETLLQIGSHAWGPGWSHFGIGGKSAPDPQGRRLVQSQANVPGSDATLLVKHTAAQAGERS